MGCVGIASVSLVSPESLQTPSSKIPWSRLRSYRHEPEQLLAARTKAIGITVERRCAEQIRFHRFRLAKRVAPLNVTGRTYLRRSAQWRGAARQRPDRWGSRLMFPSKGPFR